MNVPTTPEIQALFELPSLWTALQVFAPESPFSGQRLTLVDYTPRSGIGADIKITGPRDAGWENCEEKDWWHGSDRGDYSRQVRRPVCAAEVAKAALEINRLTVELGRELEAWTAEVKAAALARESAAAEAHRKAVNIDRQKNWEASIKNEAAARANRQLPGRENREARKALAAKIEQELLASSSRPADL